MKPTPKCRLCGYRIKDSQLTIAKRKKGRTALGELVVEILRAHFVEVHPSEYSKLQRQLEELRENEKNFVLN